MVRLCSWIFIVALTSVSLSGCWFKNTEVRDRLERGSTPAVVIPEGLDAPIFVDIMPIPEVDDPKGLAETEFDVGPPDSLSTTFAVEKIIIKRLGDQRWVFLDVPPPSVWPHVVQFWEDNNLTIENSDPASGIIETQWLASESGTGEAVFESLKLGNFLQNRKTQQHKLVLRIEPGVRSGSTEVFLEQHSIPLGGNPNAVEWNQGSDDVELESTILRALAYNLGESITDEQTISLKASGLADSRTELVLGSGQPILKYRLDFNRAWATVSSALENANINIDDLNRSEAYFYIYYTEDQEVEKGFFKRLLTRDKKPEEGDGNRYQLRLVTEEDEVHVSVYLDQSSLPDADIAEKLLKVIKLYST
tara:strand:+ start:134 stop:1222 length:1089 start_codon:yes stop_codon:yes gene_type:complete